MSIPLFDGEGHRLIVVDPDGHLSEKAALDLATALLALPIAREAIAELLKEADDDGLQKRQIAGYCPHCVSEATLASLRHAADALDGLRGVR